MQKLQTLNSLSLKYHVLGFREEKIDPKKRAPLEITETLRMIAQRHLASQPNVFEKSKITYTVSSECYKLHNAGYAKFVSPQLISPRIGNSYLSSFVSQSTACDPLEDLKELEETRKQEIKKYMLLVNEKKTLLRKQRVDLQYAQDDLVEIKELIQVKSSFLASWPKLEL